MPEPVLPEYTRRLFLNRTLQALGAVALAPLAQGATVAATGGENTAPAGLSSAEYATLDAVADTMIPHGGAFELGARDVNLARRIAQYLPRLHPDVVNGIRGALAFTEQQAPGLIGKKTAFSTLPAAERAAVLSALLAAGGLPATVFLGLKSVCMTHFYTLDSTWRFTGYDGPMLAEVAR